MKLLTKILIVLALLLAISGRMIMPANKDIGFSSLMFSNLAVLLLILYLLKETKRSSIMYWLILMAGIAQLIGSMFKIMHWPFAGALLVAGLAGSLLAGLTFISTSKKNNTGKILFLQLALGIVILFQCSLVILSPAVAKAYASLANYPIVALSATILLNKTELNEGEHNVLLLFLVQGLLFIIGHLL